MTSEQRLPAPPKRPMAEYVFVPMIRCPVCGSPRLRCYGSREQCDGSRIRYAQCRECYQRLRIILE